MNELNGGLALVPRRANQEGGRYLTAEETYDIDSPCVFLGEGNACAVHDVKPAGGRYFKCWDPSTRGAPLGCAWTKDRLSVVGWSGATDLDLDD